MACTNACQRPTPSQAHCGACHRTFGGVHGFDAHRRRGECVNPATLGMVETRRVWRRPIPDGWPTRVPQRAADGRTGPGGTSGMGPPTGTALRAALAHARDAGESYRQGRRDQTDAWREERGWRW